MPASHTLTFRASLSPETTRTFEIAENATLHTLAKTILDCFEFDFDHAFGFYDKLSGNIFASLVRYELFAGSGGTRDGARSVRKASAADAFQRIGAKMRFLYDYGDEWLFLVELVARKPKHPEIKLPRLIEAKGDAPDQYGDEGGGEGDDL